MYKKVSIINFIFLIIFLFFLGWSLSNQRVSAQQRTADAYDLSQWQSKLTINQVYQLKREVKFLILRVNDGNYHDEVFQHNVQLVERAGIPYGVYSFSRYTNVDTAIQEARQLHHLALRAYFYVNDIEVNSNNPQLVASTNAWSHTLRHLTRRPVILYSYQSMLDNQLQNSLSYYDGIWLANFGRFTPNPQYHYDLWQFSDKYHSTALNLAVDASVIPVGSQNVQSWLYRTYQHRKQYRQPAKYSSTHVSLNKIRKTSHRGDTVRRNYYTDNRIVFLRVKAKHGLTLYSMQDRKVARRVAYGSYLLVNRFIIRRHSVIAVGTRNQYYFVNKQKLSPVTDKSTLLKLNKTLA